MIDVGALGWCHDTMKECKNDEEEGSPSYYYWIVLPAENLGRAIPATSWYIRDEREERKVKTSLSADTDRRREKVTTKCDSFE
jgi:hypothetical protein